jgi:hypothetical protein
MFPECLTGFWPEGACLMRCSTWPTFPNTQSNTFRYLLTVLLALFLGDLLADLLALFLADLLADLLALFLAGLLADLLEGLAGYRRDQWDVRRGEYSLDVTNGVSDAENIL